MSDIHRLSPLSSVAARLDGMLFANDTGIRAAA
jgi:hypothetical protein